MSDESSLLGGNAKILARALFSANRLVNEWKNFGMIQTGKMYCTVDFSTAAGVSLGLRFSKTSSLKPNDPYCCRLYADGAGK